MYFYPKIKNSRCDLITVRNGKPEDFEQPTEPIGGKNSWHGIDEEAAFRPDCLIRKFNVVN